MRIRVAEKKKKRRENIMFCVSCRLVVLQTCNFRQSIILSLETGFANDTPRGGLAIGRFDGQKGKERAKETRAKRGGRKKKKRKSERNRAVPIQGNRA